MSKSLGASMKRVGIIFVAALAISACANRETVLRPLPDDLTGKVRIADVRVRTNEPTVRPATLSAAKTAIQQQVSKCAVGSNPLILDVRIDSARNTMGGVVAGGIFVPVMTSQMAAQVRLVDPSDSRTVAEYYVQDLEFGTPDALGRRICSQVLKV
jgi:hypothetical protein